MPIQDTPVNCSNCQVENLEKSKYCAQCGQKLTDIKRPIRYFLGEFVDNYLNVDAKIIRTLKLLLIHPGRLTSRFMAGQRKQFVSPVRLLVISSILFFFLFANSNKQVSTALDKEMYQTTLDTSTVHLKLGSASFTARGDSIQYLLKMNAAELENYMSQQGVKPTYINKIIIKQFAKFTQQGSQQFFNQYLKILNVSVFLLIPIFALITMLFFRNQLYVYHLIFSIHFHSLVYIIYSIGLVGDWAIGSPYVSQILFIGIAVLLFFWLRTNFYSQKKWVFNLKYFSIILIYFIVLVLFMSSVALISFGAF